MRARFKAGQRVSDGLSKVVDLVKQAEDAVVIDTTHISIDEQVDEVVRLAVSRTVSQYL